MVIRVRHERRARAAAWRAVCDG